MATSKRDFERNLAFLIHDVARLRSRAFDQMMKPYGVTRAQWWVLAYLSREDGLTQAELAGRLELGRVSLGGIVDRLEAAGWVRREQDTQDRRANRVWLTDKVRSLRRQMARGTAKLNETSLSGLDAKQVDALVDMLATIKDNLTSGGASRQRSSP